MIAAVHRTKKLQTTANQFIVNLAVCDLLLVTLILPFNIYTYLVDGWFLDMRLCKAVGFLGYSLAGEYNHLVVATGMLDHLIWHYCLQVQP